MDWLKEKLFGRLVDKAAVRVNERTLWLIVALFALVLYFFYQPEDDELTTGSETVEKPVGLQPGESSK